MSKPAKGARDSRSAKMEWDNTRRDPLPWWTWILPFFVANLGTWLSIWFKTDPGASLWYLPTALGVLMVYWWGPRVLLGVYANAVICTPLWDLPWQWSFLYALPETIEVGLSWLFFIKLARGKCWLPDLENVGRFLLFGSLVPTFMANVYLVAQLYLLGDIAQNAIGDNLRILFSADLATQLVLAVPFLILFTKPMSEKGLTQTKDHIPPLSLLPNNRNSFRDVIFITAIFAAALIAILGFSIHDLWILYGFLMILIAIRYGVNMAVLGTSWIGILAYLLPAILAGRLGLPTAHYGDFLTTNLDILFLCGVALLTGRAISDLFIEITERKQAEEELRDSEELYRVTLSNISDAVFITDDGGNFIYICLNVNVIFGYSQAEMALLGNIEKVLGANLFDSEELDARVEIQNIERQVSTKAGVCRVLLVNVKRVSIRAGTVLYTCRDITDRKRVEELLGERQHLLQKIVDTEPGTVYIYDLEAHHNVYINRYWPGAFGYTEEETQAMGDQLLQRIFHPDDLARVSTHHEDWRQTSEGNIREIEYRVRTKTGEWRWLHSREVPFTYDEAGKVKQILGIAHEITEGKLAQEALRRNEQQLGLIYDTVSDIIFLLSVEPDDRYRFVSVNKTFLQATGLNSDQVIGRYADEIIPLSSQRLVLGNYKKAIQERVPITWEEVSEYPAGTKTAIVIVNAVYNEESICTHLVGAVHDITERKHMEKAVLKERDFSDAMLNSLPGVFYSYDQTGKFLRWNRNFEIVTGYSGEEVAQMHPLDFFVGSEKAYIAQRIQQVFKNGESDAEAHLVIKNGSPIPYYFTGKRIEIDTLPYLIGMGIDITRRRQAEEALRKLNLELEQRIAARTEELAAAMIRAQESDRLKSTFLATMSHELRTPLNSIIGFTGVILQGLAGPLNEEQTKQLSMTRESARHLLALINDVLDISKIEAGQLEIFKRPFELRQAVESVLRVVQPLAQKKNLQMVASIGASVGTINNDRRRVEQVLINLVNNAIKFTERGEVSIKCQLNDGWLVTSVHDDGIGIKPEDMDRLFKPFQQIDTGLARGHEGTGLGLSICKRLVMAMGGEITVESHWGVGSTFQFKLPV